MYSKLKTEYSSTDDQRQITLLFNMEMHDIITFWIFFLILETSDDRKTCTCKNGNGKTVDW